MALASNSKITYGDREVWSSTSPSTFYRNAFAAAIDQFTVIPNPAILGKKDRYGNVDPLYNPLHYSILRERRFKAETRNRGVWYKWVDNKSQTYEYTYGERGYGLGGPSYRITESVSPNVYNRALTKFYDQIRSSDVNISTSVGEGRESLKMIRDIASGAWSVYRDLMVRRHVIRQQLLRQGRTMRRSPQLLLKQTGGLWLGWSVGLKPLLSDIENLQNHALSQDNQSLMFRLRPSRASQRVARAETTSTDSYGSTVKTVEKFDALFREELGGVICVKDYHLFENWRAGLTVRPSLAWELTTLSFVVDYFVNIGQLLQNNEAAWLNNGFSLVSGYRTSSTIINRSIKLDQRWPQRKLELGQSQNVSKTGEASEQTVTVSRTVLTSLPFQSLPSVQLPKASTPLLNIAALLAQLLRGK